MADGLPRLLNDLRTLLDQALALVSGRALAEIDRLFAPLLLPAAGQHGAEIRLPGGLAETAAPTGGSLDACCR